MLKRKKFFVCALLFLSLIRPEGALFSIVLLALFRPFSYRTALAFAIPCIVYFIWRWAYYGQLLPNTYYAKRLSTPPVPRGMQGLKILYKILLLKSITFAKESATGIFQRNYKDLREFLDLYMVRPALVALILVSWNDIKKHKYLIVGIGAFACVLALTYLPLNLMMIYAYRFYMPLLVLALVGLGAVVKNSAMAWKTTLAVVFLVLPQINKHVDGLAEEIEYAKGYKGLIENVHTAVGTYLRESIPGDEWLIVHSDAGAIPYYSKLRTVDFGRLNDPYLARRDPDIVRAADYFFERRAGAAVFTSYKKQLDHGPESLQIKRDPRFGEYTLIKKYSCKERRNYLQFLYLRRDLADSLGIEIVDTEYDRPKPNISVEDLWNNATLQLDPHKKIKQLMTILERYPDHEYAPKAMLMLGFTYSEELNNTEQAKRIFTELIAKYPESDVVATARWFIDNADKEPPEFEAIGAPSSSGGLDSTDVQRVRK
jgi:hypothetical protein